jgi:hypothetical protein
MHKEQSSHPIEAADAVLYAGKADGTASLTSGAKRRRMML